MEKSSANLQQSPRRDRLNEKSGRDRRQWQARAIRHPRIARARLSGPEFGSSSPAGKIMSDLDRGLASRGRFIRSSERRLRGYSSRRVSSAEPGTGYGDAEQQ